MPIIYRNEPDEAAEAIRTGLEKMASKRAFSTPRLRRGISEEGGAPESVQALPVYTLGLADLAKSQDTRAAIPTGWRHSLRQSNEIVANAETVIDAGGKHLFAAVDEGPLVQGTEKALAMAEAQDEIRKGTYEVRFLMVPALYVAALWFVDKTGKRDLAMPVEPAPPPLEPNKLMPFADLLGVLQGKAKAVSETERGDDTLGGA